MTPDEIREVVVEAMAEEFARLRADLESRLDRLVAAKAIPPFLPPPVWTEGRHGAGHVVRAFNGLFMARRDTESMPGDDESWLPLLVGVAGFDMKWESDRELTLWVRLSDGKEVKSCRKFDVPLVRGHWSADDTYEKGDRVFRGGEWHAQKENTGIEPGTDESAWLKVGGKHQRALLFALSRDGVLSVEGREVGSIKPLVADLLSDLAGPHLNGR
jgi:hypothetical protein